MAKYEILLFSFFAFAVLAVLSNPVVETNVAPPVKTLREIRTEQYEATFANVYRVMMNSVAPVNNTIKGAFNRVFVYRTDSAVLEFVHSFPFFDEMLACIGNILEKLLVIFNNVIKTGMKGISHGVTLARQAKYCYDQYPIKEFPSMGSCFIDMVSISMQEIRESITKVSTGYSKIMKYASRWSYIFRHCGNKRGNNANAAHPQASYSPYPPTDPTMTSFFE